MAKRTDILATAKPLERATALAALCDEVFGEVRGKAIFERIAAAMAFRGRQLGDAPAPEENHWKGVWRIYELE